MPRKYTREILATAAKESISIAGVLRRLGLRPASGTHAHVSRTLKEFKIDTSHFLGMGSNRGAAHRGPEKKTWQQVLVQKTNGLREKAHRLRRALIEFGREYRCEADGCRLHGEWLGKQLVLHVNHRNGNWLDNRPDNLQFLCPNCHSQTENYCGSKGLSDLTSLARHSRGYRLRKQGPVAE